MKKRLAIALLIGMMVTVIGCDSNKSEDKKPIKQVQEETQKQDKKEEAENVPEQKDTEITPEEDDVNTQKDETGLYEGSEGIIEVPMGTALDGSQSIGCTVKMPVSYFISGGGINQAGEEESIVLSGDTLGSYAEKGELDGYAFNMLVFGSISIADTFDFRVYPSDQVTVESEKSYAPDGVSIGTDAMPAYAYKDPQATETSHVTFCTVVQINEKMTLMLWYGGSLADELSVQELGEKLYSLVTLV